MSAPERPQGLIEGSGRAGPGKALGHMVSIRFDTGVLRAAREYADSKGLTLSDVVRLAVVDYLEEHCEEPPVLGWPQPREQESKDAATGGADG